MAVTVLGSGTSTSDIIGTKVINKSVSTKHIYNTSQEVDGLVTLGSAAGTTNVLINIKPDLSEFNVTIVPTAILVSEAGTVSFNAPSTILHTGNGFVTAGFNIGDTIRISLESDANNKAIVTIATGGLAAGSLTIDETITGSPGVAPVMNVETINWATVGTSTTIDGVLTIPVILSINADADRLFNLLIVDKNDSSNRYIINVTQSL